MDNFSIHQKIFTGHLLYTKAVLGSMLRWKWTMQRYIYSLSSHQASSWMGNKMFEQVTVTHDWSVHSLEQTFTEYEAHAIVLDTEDIKMDEKLVWLLRCL